MNSIVVKEDRDKIKECSERSYRFHFNISEVKQSSEWSQRSPFNSSEVKQHSEHSQRFYFNDSNKLKKRREGCH